MDNGKHISNVVIGTLSNWGASRPQAMVAACLAAFAQATPDKQVEVLTMLGLSKYSSLPEEQLMEVMQAFGLSKFMALPRDQQNAALALVGLTT